MKRGAVPQVHYILPISLIVHFRQKTKHDRAGVISGDVEAVEGDASSDAYVIIRRKSKQNGHANENVDGANH